MDYTYSTYQTAIFDWVKAHDLNTSNMQNLIVEAVAGSGKTFTIVHSHQFLPTGADILDCAFNKHIQEKLQPQLPQADVKTYHALGFGDIAKTLPGGYKAVKVNNYRNDDILKRRLGSQKGFMFAPIKKLVSLFKANLEPYDHDVMKDYLTYYNIDTGDLGEEAYDDIGDQVNYLLNPNHLSLNEIDFDDMCWLPVILNLPGKKYDYIFGDEWQDTNKVQIELALKHANGHTNVIGFGDRHQSIYGWRGADVDAIPNLISRLSAQTLPLSITYRNPLSVVRLVNSKFPEIDFYPRDNAPDGVVDQLGYEQFLNKAKPDDLVLCRINAPLVAPAMYLISKGTKAIIKGKDIGKNLQSLVKKVIKRTEPASFEEFLRNMQEYIHNEVWKLRDLEKHGQANVLEDNMETILALSEYCKSTDDLIYKIEMIFSDDNAGVTFSSVHRAKGLEAGDVYILHPELIPHPRATQEWAKRQERNLEYVAITRALNGLHYVI